MNKIKILVIQKKRIGDVLTSTIIFEALKTKYPESELHYLIYENSLPVVEGNIYINEIITISEKIRKSKFLFLKFLFKIRNNKYNIVIDAYAKPNSVIIGYFSGAKKRITFDKLYAKIFYTNCVSRNEISFSNATKAIEHRMLLLKPLNIPFQAIAPKIFLTNEERLIAKNKLVSSGVSISKPIVMISALGSNQSKTYPLEYMAKVIDVIAKNSNIQILFNYLPFQKKEAVMLFQLCEESTQKQIIFDFYEEDLRAFLNLTSFCSALIGNEGGATNMAKALGVPTFTIFSPIVPKNDWNMFENDKENISVHITDFSSQIVIENIKKEIEENNYHKLYLLFEPNLFENRINHFLEVNKLSC